MAHESANEGPSSLTARSARYPMGAPRKGGSLHTGWWPKHFDSLENPHGGGIGEEG